MIIWSFHKQLEESPMSVPANALRLAQEGHNLLKTNYNGALIKYTEALKAEPSNLKVYFEVAAGLFQLGRYSSAMLALTRASGSGITAPKGERPNAKAINDLYATSQNHLAAYRETLRKGTLNTPIEDDVSGIKQMYNNTGFPALVPQFAQAKAVKSTPPSALQLIQQGHNLLKTDYNGAIIKYTEALKAEPSHLNAYLEVGKGFFQLGRYAAAMLAVTRASGNGISVGTGERPDPTEINELYAMAQSHLSAYRDTLRLGTLNTPIDDDMVGLKQMYDNTCFPAPGEQAKPIMPSKKKKWWHDLLPVFVEIQGTLRF
jgi:tetratricopeptide (TPR) repeat protein